MDCAHPRGSAGLKTGLLETARNTRFWQVLGWGSSGEPLDHAESILRLQVRRIQYLSRIFFLHRKSRKFERVYMDYNFRVKIERSPIELRGSSSPVKGARGGTGKKSTLVDLEMWFRDLDLWNHNVFNFRRYFVQPGPWFLPSFERYRGLQVLLPISVNAPLRIF